MQPDIEMSVPRGLIKSYKNIKTLRYRAPNLLEGASRVNTTTGTSINKFLLLPVILVASVKNY